MSIIKDLLIEWVEQAIEDLPDEEKPGEIREFADVLNRYANAMESEHSAPADPTADFQPTERYYAVTIDEQIRYSHTFDEAELAEILDVDISGISVLEINDLVSGVSETHDRLEEAMQRYGDVQGHAINVSLG